MKVCHVSTFDNGGAFIAALRYHEQLLKMNVDSTFLIASKPVQKNFTQLYYDCYAPSVTERLLNRVNKIASNTKKLKRLKGEYELYSFPETVFRAEENEHIQKADIIHLHFVSQYINYPSFFRAIKKPFIWTLHDMNPIMGGFHYDIDFEKNKMAFNRIEKKIATQKKEITATNRIHFLTPSLWMQNKLEKSLFRDNPHTIISSGINLQVYDLISKSAFLPVSKKKKILFVAESVDNFRKGFDLLIEAVNDIDIINKAELMALGKLNNANVPTKLPVNFLGYVTDEQHKVKIYNEADVVVVPSREDNLPNIMLEAMACGKPVIAFSNGGMSDVIDDVTNGLLVKQTTAPALREAILNFLNEKIVFDAAIIRKYAEEHFCIEQQTGKLITLYKSLL